MFLPVIGKCINNPFLSRWRNKTKVGWGTLHQFLTAIFTAAKLASEYLRME